MNGFRACLVVVLFLPAWQAVAADAQHGSAGAMQQYNLGHAAFGAKNWQKALQCYEAVERFLAKNPGSRNSFDHHFRGFSASDVVKQRRALGAIRPETTHRILVMYIGKVDAPFPGGRVRSGFPPEFKTTAEASQEACARMVEVLSGGKLTLEFTRMDLDATLTELTILHSQGNESESVDTVHAAVESLLPYPAELFRQNLDYYDTFLWYWNDQGLRTSQGGYATAVGGTASIPLAPGLLTGPERGRLIVAAALLSRPGTLLHELFHTLEKCYGISPVHGFRPAQRSSFPEWKGAGEFDYYRYHFGRIARDKGFGDLALARRFPNRVTADLLAKDLELARTLKPEELRGPELFTVKLRQEGIRLHGLAEYGRALALFGRAYAIHPFDAETCYWMGLESYRNNDPSAAIRYFDEGLDVDPASAKTLQYRGVVQYARGKHRQAAADFKAAIALDASLTAPIRDLLEGKAKRGDAAANGVIEAAGLRR